MTHPKNKLYQRAYRLRQAMERFLKEFRCWAHPDDHEALQKKAETLARARAKRD